VTKLIEPAALPEARLTVQPVLRRVVDGLHPDLAMVARYHCGWTDRSGRPVRTRCGKAMRPALAFLAADTVRPAGPTRPAAVVAGATAVQLVHEFSLLHDDIMDHDRVRRGRPAAWTVYGIDRAMLCGDALLTLATAQLTNRPDCVEVLVTALLQLCSGQAHDLNPAPGHTTVADWERMAAGKTGALLAAACRLGVLLAGAGSDMAAALGDVGRRLGLAFQAVDDWLGIWGDPGLTGKPVGADLAARKHSLPVAIALAEPDLHGELRGWLRTDSDLTPHDIAALTALLDRYAIGDRVRGYADRQIALVRHTLDALSIPAQVRAQWESMAAHVTSRTA
jgi:geranylgeranyl diphosphate synthase type I